MASEGYPPAPVRLLGLVCLLLSIEKGSAWGWTSGSTVGLFVAAAVTLAAAERVAGVDWEGVSLGDVALPRPPEEPWTS